MFVRYFRYLSSSWSSPQKSLLNKERFINLFNGSGIFTNCSCNGGKSNRASFEFMNNGGEYFIIHHIQSSLIYIERIKRISCNLQIYISVTLYLRKISHSS